MCEDAKAREAKWDHRSWGPNTWSRSELIARLRHIFCLVCLFPLVLFFLLVVPVVITGYTVVDFSSSVAFGAI